MLKLKKIGAMELSMQLVVIIIIALIILGFAIKFISDQLKKGGKTISDVQEDIRDDMAAKIKESGALLEFDRTKFETHVGREETFNMAIKNIYSTDRCFRTSFTCVQAIKPDNYCDGVQNNIDVGSPLIEDESEAWFSTFYTTYVKADDISILPLKVMVRNPVLDTYQIDVVIKQADKKCEEALDEDFSEYTSQQIYVIQKS